MAIKNIWGKESTQFFQEMHKTKFHASKNCSQFLNFKIYSPPLPPIKIGLSDGGKSISEVLVISVNIG